MAMWRAMVPAEAHGVLAAIGAALFWNVILLIGKFMQERELPYLFLVGHSPELKMCYAR